MKELDVGGTLKKNGYTMYFDLPILKQVLKLCGTSLSRIKFSCSLAPATDLVAIMKEMCPNLQCIGLGPHDLTPTVIDDLTSNFGNLTDFAFEGYSRDCEDSLSIFFASKKLQALGIARANYITGRCFQSLAAEHIECLKIDDCKGLAPKNLNHVSNFVLNLYKSKLEY